MGSCTVMSTQQGNFSKQHHQWLQERCYSPLQPLQISATISSSKLYVTGQLKQRQKEATASRMVQGRQGLTELQGTLAAIAELRLPELKGQRADKTALGTLLKSTRGGVEQYTIMTGATGGRVDGFWPQKEILQRRARPEEKR